MDDFPTRIADLLETFTGRVRSMSVDRIEKFAKWIAAAPLLGVLVVLAAIFFLIGFHRVLAELIGAQWSWAAMAAIFGAVAVFLWRKRKPRSTQE